MSNLDQYLVVTEASESYLNQRQLPDYRSEREGCLQWLLTYGKTLLKSRGTPPVPSSHVATGWIGSIDTSGRRKVRIRLTSPMTTLTRRQDHFLYALSKDIVAQCADRAIGTIAVGHPRTSAPMKTGEGTATSACMIGHLKRSFNRSSTRLKRVA